MSRDTAAPTSAPGPGAAVDAPRTGDPDVLLVAIGGVQRASSRLRVHGWAPRLEAVGLRCRVLSYYDRRPAGPGIVRSRLPRIATALGAKELWNALVDAAPRVECIYLQEVLPPRSVLERIRSAGARIVFDFSDPIHVAAGPGHRLDHHLLTRFVTRPRFRAMLEAADWAIIENDRLAELVERSGSRPVVMRGPIDTRRYRPVDRDPGGPVRLGWTGSNGTLPYLEPLLPWIADLAGKGHDLEVVAFGVDHAPDAAGVRVRALPWDEASEPGVVAGFDVGLSYLPDTPWTRIRGGAKLMVYMACGVPTVSSPGGIGDQVVDSGRNGFLARTREEWTDRLERLVRDPALRERMGRAARADAVSRYSYDAYLPVLTALLRGERPPNPPTPGNPHRP